MQRLVLGISLVASLVGACGQAPPRATAVDAERAHVELAQLERGRSLLVAKCSSCHKPPLPTAHLAAEWPTKLGEMSARAGLDLGQRRMIERYLVTMAQR